MIRDSKPYPRPAGRGRAAVLAYGSFSGASAMALDGRGRILGYAFGGGLGGSVCPGGSTVVEWRGRRVYTRRLADLRVTSVRRAPAAVIKATCLNASGARVAAIAEGFSTGFESAVPYRLMLIAGAKTTVLRRGRYAGAAMSSRFAFTVEGGGRLVATDLGNGRARLLTRVTDAGTPVLNADGTRVAVHSEGRSARRPARLTVVDLSAPVARVHRRSLGSQFADGELLWQDARHLLRLPYAERPRAAVRYDAALRPLGRFGRFPGVLGVAEDRRLVAIDGDRFHSLDRTTGRASLRRRLPTESTHGVVPLPGRPLVAAGGRRPVPRAPRVRSTKCG